MRFSKMTVLVLLSILLRSYQVFSVEEESRVLCPIDMSYVQRIPWDSSPCKSMAFPSYNQDTTTDRVNNSTCCQTLLSLFGIGLAQNLRTTGFFHLPSTRISAICLSDFQSRLSAMALPSDLANGCLGNPKDRFVTTPNFCARIQTRSDSIQKIGPTPSLSSACNMNLSDPISCSSCVSEGISIASRLTTVDGNKSHATECFYLSVLYISGVVISDASPESLGTASCVFGLPLVQSPIQQKNHKRQLAVIIASSAGAVAGFLFMCVSSVIYMMYKRKMRKKSFKETEYLTDHDKQSSKSRLQPKTFSIKFKIRELERITEKFSEKNLIGMGGNSTVYKGTLSDGTLVAVKKLISSEFEADDEFRNEVETISNLNHRNLVPLRGYCIDEVDEENIGQNRYLVYDYMPNGNLSDHIFLAKTKKNEHLTWPQRKNIILDVAKGLAYLHYGIKPAIFHRDIKATNILLDSEMKARVADFGLVKQSRGQSHLTSRIAGTHGYLAPEYALYGQLTERSDVYSFGVVILEVMSGRQALDFSMDSKRPILITDWAWMLCKTGRIEEVLDENLRTKMNPNPNPEGIMARFVLVGILCSHVMVAFRPTILAVIKMLEGDIEVPHIPDRPTTFSQGLLDMDTSAFSASPSMGSPLWQPGEMLR